MRASPKTIACLFALSCAACGGSSARSPCGELGAERRFGATLYCVYDEGVVAAADGRITCPSDAPTRIDLDGALVCSSDPDVARPEDIPASVCAGLAATCGRVAAMDAGSDAGGDPIDGGVLEAGALDAAEDLGALDTGTGACPPLELRPEVSVGADVASDETWGCDRVHRLVREIVVTSGATLTIQPGTIVLADPGASITVLNDGRIDAAGTASAPIVLTSSATPGTRRAGAWLGLTMLGLAPLGAAGGVQLHSGDPSQSYGGSSERHDCGRLRYVRIEFAGNSSGRSALELLACGRDTVLDHVQVHLSAETGLSVLGGAMDLRHTIVTGSRKHGLEWDRGWTGRAQFLVVQSLAGPMDRALLRGVSRELPRSSPRIFNSTLVSVGPGRHRIGIALDNGTDGTVRNALVWGPFDAAFDVVDGDEAVRARLDPPGIDVSHAVFFGMGDDPAAYMTRETGPPEDTGDGTFDDLAWITEPSRMNRFGADPFLPAAASVFAPTWVPPIGSPTMSGASAPPDDGFFDTSATYVGAFEPGGDDWSASWTSYPPS